MGTKGVYVFAGHGRNNAHTGCPVAQHSAVPDSFATATQMFGESARRVAPVER